MNDHSTIQEQIATYLADGLRSTQRAAFETHINDCADCAKMLADSRSTDTALQALFAPLRPTATLEDRIVRSLRDVEAKPRERRTRWTRYIAYGLAASVSLGAVSLGVQQIIEIGGLSFPGSYRQDVAKNEIATASPFGFISDSPPTRGAVNFRGGQGVGFSGGGFGGGQGGGGFGGGQGGGGFGGFNYSNAPQSSVADIDADHMKDMKNSSDRVRRESMRGKNDLTNPDVGLDFSLAAGIDAKSVKREEEVPKLTSEDGGVLKQMRVTDERLLSESKGFAPGDYRFGDVDKSGRVGGKDGVQVFGRTAQEGDTKDKKLAEREKTVLLGLNDAKPAGEVFQQNLHRPAIVALKVPEAPAAETAVRKIILRSGEIEFEIESFDSAVAGITKLVTGIKGAFVGTVNSEKLPNGKVKGTITVRVPPEFLDGLVLDLRRDLGKNGELKGQRIGSQDVTKQYTDLESRLRAARTMETRLLEIIKTGKGEIKQLLEAEKELGVWRTKIEESEGEMRYYNNLASLSTLTIVLAEKEIRSAAGITENERVQAGIEVEDVDKAFRDAVAAVLAAKGRIAKSELKQLSAGQFNATLNFEIAPEASGPMRDRLRQLGRISRLEIDRTQQATAGTVTKDAKITQGDSSFYVQIYNLANVAPRETTTVQLAALDVVAAYRTIRDAVEKGKGRIVATTVNESDPHNVTAQLDFELKRTEDGTLQAVLSAAGDAISRTVTRASESDANTDTKTLYRMSFVNAARLRPRETTTLGVEVDDVDGVSAVFAAHVAEAKGRVSDSQIAHEPSGKTTAKLVYDLPLAAASGLIEKLKTAGTVRVNQTSRDPKATDGKFASARIEVTLSNTDLLLPKDDGVWHQVRKGIALSATALLASLTWLIFALCVVLPWMIVVYGGYRLVKWLVRTRRASV